MRSVSETSMNLVIAIMATSCLHVAIPLPAPRSCSTVATELFGVTLGPLYDYQRSLASGIRREGTAEVVAGVGFESLQGISHGFYFDQIMLVYDRGLFIGLTAIGHQPSASRESRQALIQLLAELLGRESKKAGRQSVFECEGDLELTVQKVDWTGGQNRVQVTLMDQVAQANMQTYINEYCADPRRRRPEDACK